MIELETELTMEEKFEVSSAMIRDFVAFSGMSPTSYLRSRTGETMFDHVVHAYPGHPGLSRPGEGSDDRGGEWVRRRSRRPESALR